MERAAKKALVTSLHDVLKDTGVVVVAHNTGMVAAQSAEFRKRVKEAGGSVKVAKNKLVQLALKDTDSRRHFRSDEGADHSGLFEGSDCRGQGCPSRTPRRTRSSSSSAPRWAATVLDANGVKLLADLPSLDELRAKLIGLLNAPATKIARTVKEPGAKLARVIQAKAAQGGEAA